MTMTSAAGVASLCDLAPGSHVCWVVDCPGTYVEVAAALLRGAAAVSEKPMLFGPEGSAPLAELAPLAAAAVDPRIAFLDGGALDPDAMFGMFREQSALARAEGYRGVRVVADMDWLLPGNPSTAATIGFELLLDRHAKELDATIVCAYRSASFDGPALAGALSVHPVGAGRRVDPPFRLVAGCAGKWRLSGEVDLADRPNFDAAIAAAAGPRGCELDVSELEFIDAAGMSAIAAAARVTAVPVRLVGARPVLRRAWRLAGFADVAPTVQLLS